MTIYRVLSMSMVTSFEKIEVFSENLREMQYNIESIQDFLTMKELPEPSVRANISSYDVKLENEHLIQAAISELTKGKTIVTIAHRLATIEQADQILVVDDGQIVQRGIHKELVTVPVKYKDFVDIRSQSEGWKIS